MCYSGSMVKAKKINARNNQGKLEQLNDLLWEVSISTKLDVIASILKSVQADVAARQGKTTHKPQRRE